MTAPADRAPRRANPALAAATSALFVGLALFLYLGRDDRGPVARLMLDAPYYHAYLVSLHRDHDLDFANEYRRTGNYENFARVAATGKLSNPFGIGPPIYSAPFYALGTWVAWVAGKDTRGFGELQTKITLVASPFFTAASLIFVVRLLRRRVAPGQSWVAIAAGVAAVLSGPAFYYAVRQPGNSHPMAAFFTAWLLDAWDASYDRPRSLRAWLGLGALFGATALARPQLALWGIVLVAAALDDARRVGWREAAPRWLAAAGLALAIFSPQCLVWKAIYGRFWLVPQGPGFMVWSAPSWSEVLFSSRNGLFSWSPLYAFAIVGLVAGIRRAPRTASLLLAGFALQVIANGAVWDWWAGPSWGGRRFDSCLLAFAFGLGVLFTLRRRLIALAMAGVAVICSAASARAELSTGVWDLMTSRGEPIEEWLPSRLVDWLAAPYAALSKLTTLPARVAFALRYGTDLDRYDWVVGAHFASEFFPGLGGVDRRLQTIQFFGNEKYAFGFDTTRMGGRMRGPRARLLVPLNKRHGPVMLTLRFRSRTTMSAWWDGRPIGATRNGTVLEVALAPVDRGVHTLDLEAAAGTTIWQLYFEVPRGVPP